MGIWGYELKGLNRAGGGGGGQCGDGELLRASTSICAVLAPKEIGERERQRGREGERHIERQTETDR